jgi:hypothetical protein
LVESTFWRILAFPEVRHPTYFPMGNAVDFVQLELVVSESPKKPARPWRLVADEMSHAPRGDRMLELAEELERAFQEQKPGPRKGVKPAVPEIARMNGNDENLQPRKQNS